MIFVRSARSVLLPGLVDLHVHLRDPGFTHKEDFHSGAESAVAGGFSVVCCMPNTHPVIDSPEMVRDSIRRVRGLPTVIFPIAAVTFEQKGKTLTDFSALKAAGAVALSDDGRPVSDADLMREAMIRAAAVGLPIVSHCEVLPDERGVFHGIGLADDAARASESVMAARDIALSAETGCPVHIAHVSLAETAALVRDAKKGGVRVTAETCPHYLLLTENDVDGNTDRKMNPPLRRESDRLALIEAIVDGTIDILCTDHAPHTPGEKDVSYRTAPNGVIGLETALAACWTALRGRLTLDRVVELMSTVPARLFGLRPPPKDFFRFAPDEPWVVEAGRFHSKSRNTPFAGMTLYGKIYAR